MVLYAQGYKFDFSEKKFKMTGTIAMRVNTDAKIFIDNNYSGDTTFFTNSYSIDKLLPGTYKLSVQKDGYSLWRKNVSVEERFVNDFPNIMLLPIVGEERDALFSEIESLFLNSNSSLSPSVSPGTARSVNTINKKSPVPSPTPELIRDNLYFLNKQIVEKNGEDFNELIINVEGFKLYKNGNKLFWWSKGEIWVMWLEDTGYQPIHKKGDKEIITKVSFPIQNGNWLETIII